MEPTPLTRYREKILSSLAWQGAAQFLGQLTSWASTVLVIRLLDPSDYGLMAMATLFVSFLLMLADLGIGAAVVQAENLEEEDFRSIQGLILVFNGAALGSTLLASPLMAHFFDEPGLVPILNVLSVNFLFLTLYVLPQSRLMRDLRFDSKAKVDLTTLVMSALTSLAFAWFGFGVWALVAGTVCTHLVRAIGFNWVVRDLPWPRLERARAAPFIRFGSTVVLSRFLWFAYSNLDVTIAGKVLGADILGFYSVALNLAAIPLDKIGPVLNQVAFPAVSRIQKEPERVRTNMRRALRYGNLIFLPVFWGIALVAPDAFPLLLGDHWGPAVLPFQMICVILPLKAVASLLPPALFGVGRPMVNVTNMGITLVLMAIGFVVGTRWGLVGLAGAWLVSYPVAFTVTTTRALPVVGMSWGDLFGAWRGTVTAGFVMAATVLVLQAGLEGADPVLRLALTMLAGAFAYAGSIAIGDRAMVGELRELLTR